MKSRKSFYEQSGGTYTQVGDVLLPNPSIGEDGQQPIGKSELLEKPGGGEIPRLRAFPWYGSVLNCYAPSAFTAVLRSFE